MSFEKNSDYSFYDLEEGKDIVVLYHSNCNDGMGAAYAAFKKFGDKAQYIPVNYNDTKIPKVDGKEVYILDFAYPDLNLAMHMRSVAKKFKILDHHKTAWEKYREVVDDDIVFDMNRSGAMMAWNFFHPTCQAPKIIEHVQDYDLWKFELPGTREFIMNSRSYEMNLENWSKFENMSQAELDIFIKEGETQTRLIDGYTKSIAEYGGRECIFDGEVGLAVNCNVQFSSAIGNILATKCNTFGLVYFLQNRNVYWGIRSNGSYDCSRLAVMMGGGGHRNAAGFRTNTTEFANIITGNHKIIHIR